MKLAGHVAWQNRNGYKGLTEKYKSKPFGIARREYEDNIKRCRMGGIGWIQLDQDRDPWRALVWFVLNPSGSVRHWGRIE
jgi:hypothetical protein